MKKLFALILLAISSQLMAQTCADTVKFEIEQDVDGLVYVYALSEVSFLNQVDFGDGFIGDIGSTYSHLYTSNNNFNICLTVYDSVQSCTSSYCLPVSITDAMLNPCASKFQYSMTDSSSAYFYPTFSSSSYIGSEHYWDFGNGQTFNDGLEHVIDFIPDNSYNICLQTINSIIGCSHSYCDSLVISNSICPFSINMNTTIQQDLVTINIDPVGSSIQSSGLIDYGDGYSDYNLWHRYAAPGTYIINANIYDGYNYWNCETTLVDTVVITSAASNLCEHTLTYEEVPGTGFYSFNSNVVEAMNGVYSYYWDFGLGYNLDASSLTGISYTGTGSTNVCNVVTSTSGCTDTSCVNFTVGYSADIGPCFLTPTQMVRVYKDDSYAFFMFTANSIPPLLPVDIDVTLGSATGNAGQVTMFGYGFDPSLLTTYDVNTVIPYGCAASNYNTLTPNSWSNFTCDSVVKDVLVQDIGGGRFKITPVLDSYILNNLWAFEWNYQLHYNINGFNFNDGAFSNGAVSFYIQMPYQGNFSGYLNVSSSAITCNCQNTYFSIDNSAAAPSANCDAYFTLDEDTAALLPYTWILNNLSSGNDLAYLWEFGDGDTSTAALPSHTYATPDYYEITLTITDTINGCTDFYFSDARAQSELIQYIVPGSLLNISSEDFNAPLSIYPNPTTDFVKVNGLKEGNYSIEIYDATGRNVKRIENSDVIDMKGFVAGIYIMLIQQDGLNKTFKLVKE